MAVEKHRTHIYVGLAGEGEYIGSGGLYRYAEDDGEWQSLTKGLPPNPQVRALLVHPENPAIIYAGTHVGPYRSDDRGEHWEALEAPPAGTDVWSLAFHPSDPGIVFAGYEPCAIYRSEDGGIHWKRMNTERVTFPHITTYMPPLGKRVIGIAADPSNPMDMYASIEVGGLLASRDGGESWESIIDGPYVRNNTLDLHGVQVSQAAPGTVYIITQVAMFRSRDRGQHWEHVQVEEMFPGGSYCRGLLVAPDDPQTIYLAAGAGGGGAPRGTQEAGALFRSRDIGETWERVDLGDTPPSRMAQIAIDRAAPAHVYCCAQHGQVYRSDDAGQTWQRSQVPVEMSRPLHIYPMVCG
ncbi:MAG: VPS10 domain-containing protein [Candidatus Entotheonellia bacterium]